MDLREVSPSLVTRTGSQQEPLLYAALLDSTVERSELDILGLAGISTELTRGLGERP
jgi:hypothetical protein